MHIHTSFNDEVLHYKFITNKDYKNLLTCIYCKDAIGMCDIIDEWTDKSYNVYQKFFLLLHIYNNCINDKLVFTHNGNKHIYYLDDLIQQLKYFEHKNWINLTDNISILVQLPFKFYDNIFKKDHTLTISEMNEYFFNTCITHINVDGTIQQLTRDEIDLLPSNIFDKITEYIRNLDAQLQQTTFFGVLNFKLSLFTLLGIIQIIFNTDRNNFLEFEYAVRRHMKITTFDDMSYKYARDIANFYTHEMQEQQSAIEDAKNKYANR